MTTLERYHRRMVLRGSRKPLERLILFLLLPLALVYGIIGWLRCKGYSAGLFASYTAPVKVISVGNLAVGGTGKTPVVDWLAKWLVEQGRLPVIISRGYGGTFSGSVGTVSAGQGIRMSPPEAGDEPCLLARRNPGVPVLIAPKRAAGIRQAVEKYHADVVILDDGFQHLAVKRDIDLVLVDGTSPLGNGLPLPAGLLREFPTALRRADLVLLTRADKSEVRLPVAKPAWKSRHRLTEHALTLQGEQVPLPHFAGKRLLAFAGIAEPDGFFRELELAGLTIEKKLPLADHERYDERTLNRIRLVADGMDAMLTTEKDGVKLSTEAFPIPCYQVPMTISIDNESEFKAELFRRLWRNE